MTLSDRGWTVLVAYVAVWDFTCPRGETLSGGCRRHAERHPVAVAVLLGFLYFHLLGRIPSRMDPLSRLLDLKDWLVHRPLRHVTE